MSFEQKSGVPAYWPKVFRTLCEMFRDRGYTFKDKKNVEWKPVYNLYRKVARAGKKDKKVRIRVYVNILEKVGKPAIEAYIRELKADGISHAVIVFAHKLTDQGAKIVDMISSGGAIAKRTIIDVTNDHNATVDNFNVELFSMDELTYNVTKHVLQPEFVLLSDVERAALFDEMKITEHQLPKITTNDPVVRYYGWRIRDVVFTKDHDGNTCYCVIKRGASDKK